MKLLRVYLINILKWYSYPILCFTVPHTHESSLAHMWAFCASSYIFITRVQKSVFPVSGWEFHPKINCFWYTRQDQTCDLQNYNYTDLATKTRWQLVWNLVTNWIHTNMELQIDLNWKNIHIFMNKWTRSQLKFAPPIFRCDKYTAVALTGWKVQTFAIWKPMVYLNSQRPEDTSNQETSRPLKTRLSFGGSSKSLASRPTEYSEMR